MFRRWWVRGLAIFLVAIVVAVTLVGLSFRISVKPENGLISIAIERNITQAAITVTALGTFVNKTASYIDFSLTSGVTAGDWYIVAYAGDTALVISGDPSYTILSYAAGVYTYLTEDAKASNGGNVIASILSVKAAQTKAWDGINPMIRLSNGTSDAKTMTVYKVTGLDATPLDKTNTGTGIGVNASTGSTGVLSQADEIAFAATGVEDEVDDAHGTWTSGAGYVSGNEQFDATNGGGDTSNIQVHSVAMIVSATDALQGVDAGHDSSDWAAAIATYKMATGGTPAITVSPTSYDFGVIATSSTPSTTTTYFTIDNTSDIQTDQTISVTTATWSGGVTWTHSETATPGADTAGLKANKGGTWGTGDVIIKYNSPNYIAENQAALTDYQFGLKLWSPTSFSDGAEKTIIVRVTAVAG